MTSELQLLMLLHRQLASSMTSIDSWAFQLHCFTTGIFLSFAAISTTNEIVGKPIQCKVYTYIMCYEIVIVGLINGYARVR